MVDNEQIKFGQYESVDFEGNGSGTAHITLNPDMTATHIVYDTSTGQTQQKLVTTKFEVRPIRNGDIPSMSFNCVAADGGPCFDSSFNGRTALIIEPDGTYETTPKAFFVTHEAPSDSNQRGDILPHGCDFEPVVAQQYGCYRFLSK